MRSIFLAGIDRPRGLNPVGELPNRFSEDERRRPLIDALISALLAHFPTTSANAGHAPLSQVEQLHAPPSSARNHGILPLMAAAFALVSVTFSALVPGRAGCDAGGIRPGCPAFDARGR